MLQSMWNVLASFLMWTVSAYQLQYTISGLYDEHLTVSFRAKIHDMLAQACTHNARPPARAHARTHIVRMHANVHRRAGAQPCEYICS